MKATAADLAAAADLGRRGAAQRPPSGQTLAHIARIVSDDAMGALASAPGAPIGSAESRGARRFGGGHPHPPSTPAPGGSARPTAA